MTLAGDFLIRSKKFVRREVVQVCFVHHPFSMQVMGTSLYSSFQTIGNSSRVQLSNISRIPQWHHYQIPKIGQIGLVISSYAMADTVSANTLDLTGQRAEIWATHSF